jgi:hypothetical protein
MRRRMTGAASQAPCTKRSRHILAYCRPCVKPLRAQVAGDPDQLLLGTHVELGEPAMLRARPPAGGRAARADPFCCLGLAVASPGQAAPAKQHQQSRASLTGCHVNGNVVCQDPCAGLTCHVRRATALLHEDEHVRVWLCGKQERLCRGRCRLASGPWAREKTQLAAGGRSRHMGRVLARHMGQEVHSPLL